MMNFLVNPIAVLKADKPIPPVNDILTSLIEQGNIPIAVITDEKDELYQSMMQSKPPELELKYLVMTITYLENFEA